MCNEILLPPILEVVTGKLESNHEEMESSADEFENSFIECVERTLTDLLGAQVREAVLDYLARHDRLSRGDIIGHPRELSVLLDKMFGKGGATIERRIIGKLYATLGCEYKEPSNLGFDFKFQLQEARACWKRFHDARA